MGPTVSSTNKTDRYDITEILLNIKQTNKHIYDYGTFAFENRQFNNEVFKIVSYDKAYTQFAGHYPIQSVFRNRVSIESLQT